MTKVSISDDTFRVSRPYPRKYAKYSARGASEARPWSLESELLSRSGKDRDFLDIGCGDSRKTAPLADHFRSLTALDPSDDMLQASRATFRRMKISNAKVVQGCGESLPFPDESFDVVSCILAGYHFHEIFRVLRPGGHVVIEAIGPSRAIASKVT